MWAQRPDSQTFPFVSEICVREHIIVSRAPHSNSKKEKKMEQMNSLQVAE